MKLAKGEESEPVAAGLAERLMADGFSRSTARAIVRAAKLANRTTTATPFDGSSHSTVEDSKASPDGSASVQPAEPSGSYAPHGKTQTCRLPSDATRACAPVTFPRPAADDHERGALLRSIATRFELCRVVAPSECLCTLARGHEGDHVAGGLGVTVHDRWAQAPGREVRP